MPASFGGQQFTFALSLRFNDDGNDEDIDFDGSQVISSDGLLSGMKTLSAMHVTFSDWRMVLIRRSIRREREGKRNTHIS